jgi:phage tail sheath protein FI
MGFLVSPGVEVKEIDLTNVIPAVSTSIGGFVGEFRWGPVGEAITVSSEKELASYYGTPNDDTAVSFLTAGSFLKYGNALKVSRALGDNSANASVNNDGSFTLPKIKNYTDFLAQKTALATAGHTFIARYPGSIANGLIVYTASCGGTLTKYTSVFKGSATTGASSFSSKQSSTDSQRSEIKDEVHVVIVDDLGNFTGTKGAVLEVWEGLSVFRDALKDDGSSLFFIDVINANSSYVYVVETAGLQTNIGYAGTSGIARPASAYYDGNSVTNSNGQTSWVLGLDVTNIGSDDSLDEGDYADAAAVFEDAETIDVNLLFTAGSAAIGSTGYSEGEKELLRIANARKDCVAFISAPLSVATATSDANRLLAVTGKFGSQSATRSSYAVWDSTPLYVYNKYADKYLWIPASGHIAGLCANTDNVAEPWFSPAGYNRGNLLGVTKLAFNPKQADRDTLYKLGVNPIVAFPGQGILLFGDKTAQAKPSAFDRINVRRLFITLEKAISTAAKYQLFELNDEFTRAMFRNMVEPFLREVKGRRGVTDFLVICDETNNTGEVIDTNRFVADIYIKPARSINFITLNFIATRTGVEFSEIVGK